MKSVIAKLISLSGQLVDPLRFNALILVVALFLTSGIRYLFHMVMTRIVDKGLYGELSVLIGITAVVGIPIGTITTVLVREIAVLSSQQKNGEIAFLFFKYIRSSLRYGILLALILCALGLVFGYHYVYFIAPLIPITFLLAILMAYFQGRERMITLALIQVLVPVIECGGAVLIILFTHSFDLFLIAYSFAPLVVFLVFYERARRELSSFPLHEHPLQLKRASMLLFFSNVMLMLYFYEDLFFVRALLGSDAAGVYNVASMTARLLFFVSSAMGGAVLPYASRTMISRSLLTALFQMMVVLFLIFLIFVLTAEPFLTFFYGSAYAEGAIPFILLSAAYFLISITYLLVVSLWSQRLEHAPLMVIAATFILNSVFLSLSIPSFGVIGAAASMVVSSLCFFILTSLYFAFTTLNARPISSPS